MGSLRGCAPGVQGVSGHGRGRLRHKEGAESSGLAALPPRSCKTMCTFHSGPDRGALLGFILSLCDCPLVGSSPEGEGRALVTCASSCIAQCSLQSLMDEILIGNGIYNFKGR